MTLRGFERFSRDWMWTVRIVGESVLWLVHCWSFTSLQHLRSYQGTMTQYPTQAHYPDTDVISPCRILLMPSTRLGSDKYQFYKTLFWLERKPNSGSPAPKASALPIRPLHPVRGESLLSQRIRLNRPTNTPICSIMDSFNLTSAQTKLICRLLSQKLIKPFFSFSKSWDSIYY